MSLVLLAIWSPLLAVPSCESVSTSFSRTNSSSLNFSIYVLIPPHIDSNSEYRSTNYGKKPSGENTVILTMKSHQAFNPKSEDKPKAPMKPTAHTHKVSTSYEDQLKRVKQF